MNATPRTSPPWPGSSVPPARARSVGPGGWNPIAAAAMAERWPFELVYVNDGSTDATETELTRLMAEHCWLRQVKHANSCGQSAAVRSGVAAARGPLVVTLDGDGQNDPSFIPALVRSLEQASPRTGLIAGQRVGRRSSRFKQFQSRVANGVRAAI